MFALVTLLSPSAQPSARDLGFLLHKHPDRVYERALRYGTARVFFPRADHTECTAAVWVDADPAALHAMARRRGATAELRGYLNDRAYAASSLLAVAVRACLHSAFMGTADAAHQALADSPLELRLTVVGVRAEEATIRELWEPLGWRVEVSGSRYASTVVLTGTALLRTALRQLYVLIPVLDGTKHYWVAQPEVDKVVEAAAGWLPAHPGAQRILAASLAHQPDLVAAARERLGIAPPPRREPHPSQQRLNAVVAQVLALRPRVVVDFGCGEGKLIRELVREPTIARIIGADASAPQLERAEKRLAQAHLGERQLRRGGLVQAAAPYAGERLAGAGVMGGMEGIEHIDPSRLPEWEQLIFGQSSPEFVVLTTPNREFNATFSDLSPGQLRHGDHRFEFDRAGFAQWTRRVCAEFGYVVECSGIGQPHASFGPPTFLAVFSRTF
ncbi:3' terminal RNA ribose 2'-O-methyltransferase Hen1 [Corynebacterium sp. Marseille-Q2516]